MKRRKTPHNILIVLFTWDFFFAFHSWIPEQSSLRKWYDSISMQSVFENRCLQCKFWTHIVRKCTMPSASRCYGRMWVYKKTFYNFPIFSLLSFGFFFRIEMECSARCIFKEIRLFFLCCFSAFTHLMRMSKFLEATASK